MDRGAWQVTVHGVIKSWTQLSSKHFHFHSGHLELPVKFMIDCVLFFLISPLPAK